jgi:anthranilate synthase component 1
VADIVTRTLSADHTTPVRAYAALRAQTQGRSSFLLETLSSKAGRGRYSVLGYRARTESLYPGGGNALSLIADDLAGGATPEGFAVMLSQALVGYITYDAVHALQGIEPWPDEGDLARMMRDATVVVFDLLEHTLTIAGKSKGAVDRCEWEMTHGPELLSMKMPDPKALPEHLDVPMDDAVYAERAGRARKYVTEGAVSRVVLARMFRAPMRGSDPFDVYRALRVLDPSPYHFFLEFGDTPMAEGQAIAGSSSEPEAMGGAPSDKSASDMLHAAIPPGAMMGAPKEKVPAIIRELEPSARGAYGGAIGYLSQDGTISLAVATTTVVLKRGYLETRGSASITEGSEAGSEAAQTVSSARTALAAIRAAQELAKVRQEVEAAKRAKEEAAEAAKATEAAKAAEAAGSAGAAGAAEAEAEAAKP